MVEYYMNDLDLQCNIQLHCFPIAFVLNIIRTVTGWTKVISEAILEGLDVNPGRLGQFSNIFINYAGLLCLLSVFERTEVGPEGPNVEYFH
jgi:hypothetical protein